MSTFVSIAAGVLFIAAISLILVIGTIPLTNHPDDPAD